MGKQIMDKPLTEVRFRVFDDSAECRRVGYRPEAMVP